MPEVIERMLNEFHTYEIQATFGIVGALACSSVDELLNELAEIPFTYLNERCHPKWITESIRNQPFGYMAPQIVKQIRAHPQHEIASHTFSHFYTHELPFSAEAWEKDLEKSKKWLPEAETLLFPRNQYHIQAIELAKTYGYHYFRTNPNHFLYHVYQAQPSSLPLRGLRFIDHLLPLSAHQFSQSTRETCSYSRFLRPASSSLWLTNLKLNRIKQSMSVAAVTGRAYHLWWHPHNFSHDMELNMKGLQDILQHYQYLHETYGMESRTVKQQCLAQVPTT